MAVYQRKDGRFFVQWRDKKTGKLKKKGFGRGFDAEMEAKKFNERLELREWKRRTPKRAAVYFAELVNSYYTAAIGRQSETSLANFEIKMERIILPTLGEQIEAPQITPARLDNYCRKRFDAGVKATTIARELDYIQAVLNWSVRRQYLIANPVFQYEKPKRDDERIRPPSASESRALVKAAMDAPHLLRAISIAHFTGLRPGVAELFRLQWSAVDFDARTIRVKSARKGGLDFRDVPVAKTFARQLRAWYDADGRPENGFIIQWRGKPVSSIKTAWKNAKDRAGIKRRLRPYDCRHAFASAILRAGGDLKTTSRLLGHTRTATTTEIYQHIDAEMGRTAVDKLPDIFGEKSPDGPRPEGGNVVKFEPKKRRAYKKDAQGKTAQSRD